MAKPKLFIWSDSPNRETGFGRVARQLLWNAHQDFEVAFLGINDYGINKYDTKHWFVYPVSRDDFLGLRRFKLVLQDFKPDIIFLFQDVFHIQSALPTIREVCPNIPIVTYFPVDGGPFNLSWKNVFDPGIVKTHFTYSQFALDTIFDRFPDLKEKLNIKILNHGVDSTVFKLLDKHERRALKNSFGWKDKFVAINVNRFQPRKFIPLTLRISSLISHGYKRCQCGNYYLKSKSHCDLNGCDETKVKSIEEPNTDYALYLHMNVTESTMGPPPANSLQLHALNAGYVDADMGKNLFICNKSNLYADPYTDDELNGLYNAADLNISTTLGEGWGLSLSEAAATGTISIAPKNSAIPEVLKGTSSKLIDNQCLINIALDSGHLRPVVSAPSFIKAITAEYEKWKEQGGKKFIDYEAITTMQQNFSWEDKRLILINEFKTLLPTFFGS